VGCSVTAAEARDPSFVRPQDRRCAACHEPSGPGAPLAPCWGCGLALHLRCWTERERCPTPGCGMTYAAMIGRAERPAEGEAATPSAPRRAPRPLRPKNAKLRQTALSVASACAALLWLHCVVSLAWHQGAVTAAIGAFAVQYLAILLLFGLGAHALRDHRWFGNYLGTGGFAGIIAFMIQSVLFQDEAGRGPEVSFASFALMNLFLTGPFLLFLALGLWLQRFFPDADSEPSDDA